MHIPLQGFVYFCEQQNLTSSSELVNILILDVIHLAETKTQSTLAMKTPLGSSFSFDGTIFWAACCIGFMKRGMAGIHYYFYEKIDIWSGGCAIYGTMSTHLAFIGSRDPVELTAAELKLWLQKRKKSTKGK